MKFATILFSILLFLNGILLTFQYHVFSTNTAKEEKTFNYKQDIELTYTGKSLVVKQNFSNLPSEDIQIKWPEDSKAKGCEKNSLGEKDDKECKRLDKTKSKFVKADKDTQTISYTIPLSKKGIQNEHLYKNIYASLKQGIAVSTSVQIVDKKRIKGQWFTGLPRIGEQSLSLVDYTYFKGTGAVYDLYWQKKKQTKVFASAEISVYSKKMNQTNLSKSLSSLKMLSNGHIDVIESSRNTNGSRILFTKSLAKKQLQEKVAISQITKKYNFANSNGDLPTILASFATGMPLGNDKSKKMVQLLNDYFSSEQKTMWKEGLEDLEGKKVDSNVLDKLLSDTVSTKTSYFQLNEASGKTVVPLLFEETRGIYVNGLQVKDLKVILKDESILYAANPILEQLGYKARVGKNGYYITGKNRSFRFPGEQYNFYVDDGVRYNTSTSQPVVKVGGTYYIEETWLIRLFRLDINKSETRIDVNDGTNKK